MFGMGTSVTSWVKSPEKGRGAKPTGSEDQVDPHSRAGITNGRARVYRYTSKKLLRHDALTLNNLAA